MCNSNRTLLNDIKGVLICKRMKIEAVTCSNMTFYKSLFRRYLYVQQ